MGLDCHDFLGSNFIELDPAFPQTARQILFKFLPGLRVVTDNIDLISLNPAISDQLPPHRISQCTTVVVGQDLAAGDSRSFAIGIELFERGLIDSQ